MGADGGLRYARHFLLLAALAAVLAATAGWRSSSGAVASFGLYGALHASAVIASLRQRGSLRGKVMFVATSAALSVTIALASIRAPFSALPGFEGPILVLMLASGLGAVSYTSLIRYFWMESLTLHAIVSIALGCMVATLACLMVEHHVGALGGLGLAVAWWFALSAGLWWATRTPRATVPSQPIP